MPRRRRNGLYSARRPAGVVEADDDRLDAALAPATAVRRSRLPRVAGKGDRRDRRGSARPAGRRRDSAGVPRRRTPADRRRCRAGFGVAETRSRTSVFPCQLWTAASGKDACTAKRITGTRTDSAATWASSVYGHWGPPMIAFPTSGGDEWEYERQGLIGAIASAIDAGRVKVFCVNTNNGDSFVNDGAHPRHRSWMQAHVRRIHRPGGRCRSCAATARATASAIWTMGASLGGYHAANTLLKHPDIVKRCFALSGVYDMKRFMGGDYDDNFYFNNPVDYMRQPDGPLGAASARELRHPPGDRHGAVGASRRGVPPVGHSREPRHPPSSRRLGPAGRPRLAVLAAPDVGVHE